uniref:Uncharacterized protein n=1 Tax=Rangifer tarandus platyrhynchus TaxID=3082113 RepID=A0ACB0EY41_RANTA|nr:unnamed protein product [Rangifer tarandus platyrhynchus]
MRRVTWAALRCVDVDKERRGGGGARRGEAEAAGPDDCFALSGPPRRPAGPAEGAGQRASSRGARVLLPMAMRS